MTDEALDALKHGEVQRARRVLALLASENRDHGHQHPFGVPSRSREGSRAADRSGQDRRSQSRAAVSAQHAGRGAQRASACRPACEAVLKRAEPLVEDDGQRSEDPMSARDIVERSPAAVGNGRTAGL